MYGSLAEGSGTVALFRGDVWASSRMAALEGTALQGIVGVRSPAFATRAGREGCWLWLGFLDSCSGGGAGGAPGRSVACAGTWWPLVCQALRRGDLSAG